MYIIESINQKQNFFYSIGLEKTNAEAHFERLKTKNVDIELKRIDIDTFPIYAIEQLNSFTYLTREDALQVIKNVFDNQTYVSFDDDFVLFIIYIIDEEMEFDFDYVGILNHVHTDKDFFERFVKYGDSYL